MKVGIPSEVKVYEGRVAITPAGVRELTAHSHEVVIQAGAGTGSGISDARYQDAGASIVQSAEEVWSTSEMIIKVKEPVASEYGLIGENQTIFT